MIIEGNGLELRCEVEGPETATAVVFIHGLAASAEIWSGQAERLRDAYRTVRYDLRSHGLSETVDIPCTRSDLAADLVGLLDALGIPRAVLVGHSGGGVVAMQTAVDNPERVAALGLVGTASECNDKTAAWYAETAETAHTAGGASVMCAMGMKPEGRLAPDGPGCAHVTLAMRTLNAAPLTDALAKVRVPTLIVVGETDFLGVGGSVILSRAIEGSELEIVTGRGHGVYLEDPDWFAGRLRRFLEERVEVQAAI
ncbi:MAG: alpha/beta fold hydrolase [Myxococcales bacterium]|nr:MAG: alpha/beta fold hydrolase [Myxococcales bacterium]